MVDFTLYARIAQATSFFADTVTTRGFRTRKTSFRILVPGSCMLSDLDSPRLSAPLWYASHHASA